TVRKGPQLLDFNLASDPHSATRAEEAWNGGTLPYMAPEQLQAFLDPAGWERVGPTADIYSLGLVLRELLTGETPELPNPKIPLTRAIRELLDHRIEPPQAPSGSVVLAIPKALEAIVARCLAPRPEGRYADATDLAADLERFLEKQPLRHAVNPSRRELVSN